MYCTPMYKKGHYTKDIRVMITVYSNPIDLQREWIGERSKFKDESFTYTKTKTGSQALPQEIIS